MISKTVGAYSIPLLDIPALPDVIESNSETAWLIFEAEEKRTSQLWAPTMPAEL